MRGHPLIAAWVLLAANWQAGGPNTVAAHEDHAVGAGGLAINETIGHRDGADPVRRHPCKVIGVHLEAGKTYVLEMQSRSFDSYLRLSNPSGRQVAQDDDSGGNLNARIVYRAASSGGHQLYCTTFAGGAGPFTLTVRELGQTVASAVAADRFAIPSVQEVPNVNLPQWRKLNPK